MVAIIIIGVIVVLFALCFFVKPVTKSSNPIDSIRISGTLGFKIGDSEKKVLSRIKSLDLATEEDIEDYISHKEIFSGLPTHHITCAKNIFNHIDDITLDLKYGKLAQITITFTEKGEFAKSLMPAIVLRISKRIGRPSYISNDTSICKWYGDYVTLSNLEGYPMRLFIGDSL